MDVIGYYRRAMFLPLVLPFAAMPLYPLIDGAALPGLVAFAIGLLFWSLVIGGVPYVVFLVLFLRWMRGKTARRVRRAVLMAPLRYTSVLFAWVLVWVVPLALLDGGRLETRAVWALTACALVVGYAYVALAEAGRWLLERAERRGGVADAV